MMTIDMINRLRQINWVHGKGEIKSITIDVDNSTLSDGNPKGEVMFCGTVTRRFAGGMRDDVRKWSCDGRSVKFLGRTKVLYVFSGRKPAC